MSEEIRILVELSRADLECSRLSGRTESIPRELDKHEAELMVHGRALEVLELHAEDADVVMWGTGGDERRVGKAEIRMQAERDWSQSDSIAMKFGWTSVSARGPVAWVSADLAISWSAGGRQHSVQARFSGVLEQRDGGWSIVQDHFSLPATEQASGESYPLQAPTQ